MSFDGENFNQLIERTLRDRMYRLLRDAEPWKIDGETFSYYQRTHKDLFGYPPSMQDNANPWQVVIVVLVGIRDRLVDIARPHRRASVEERGDYPEFFDIEQKLDDEENDWRAAINLLPVHSESLR
jgi:hypothetical protein